MIVTEIRVTMKRTVQPVKFEPETIEVSGTASVEPDEDAAACVEVLYHSIKKVVDDKVKDMFQRASGRYE